MGDVNKASSIAKNIQKHAGRAKELLRQNIGKADRTTDEEINEYVKNFNSQQCAVARLTKEIKNYQNCFRALQTASKALTDVICDLYEPNWSEHDRVQVQVHVLEKTFEDYQVTFDEQVVKPLIAYSEQFPDLQQKILKRRRKLLDYDNCRHTIQNLEQHPRKKEESKIGKAREQLAEKRSLYETINSELLEELPALYDSRVSFLASNLQCFFIAEATFHCEASKVFCDLNEAVEILAAENQNQIYSIKKQTQQKSCPVSTEEECSLTPKTDLSEARESSADKFASAESPSDCENGAVILHSLELVDQEKDVQSSEHSENSSVEALPSKEHEVELPSGVLYQVEATFQYTAEDADELSIEPGDIINVVEFDDPEQKEDGWLMGYKAKNMEKGLFPLNFTKPV